MSEPVALTFSLKYLVNFCKASGLSDRVKLCLSDEVPLLVEYALSNNSYLRFYLAPKVITFSSTQIFLFADTLCRLAMRNRPSLLKRLSNSTERAWHMVLAALISKALFKKLHKMMRDEELTCAANGKW